MAGSFFAGCYNKQGDEDLKNRLSEVAQAQHRTTSNLIEWLIKQYLEQIAKRGASTQETDSETWDKQITAAVEARKIKNWD